MTFYNTNKTDTEDLKKEYAMTEHQEEAIIKFFRSQHGEFTPFEVQYKCFDCRIPITSVRRAMTNLTDAGVLEKTDNVRKGIYGKNNLTWKLAETKPTETKQEELFHG